MAELRPQDRLLFGTVRRHVAALRPGVVEAVVARRFEMEDRHVLLQERDERNEESAVQAVLVEIVGRDVRCRHHRHAPREQLLEQASEDHRVGDVGDGKFVEAEQADFIGDRLRDGSDRIASLGAFALPPLTQLGDAVVRLGHERVKMRAPFRGRYQFLEEEIHQQRLAAPDPAEDVKAARRDSHRFAAEQLSDDVAIRPGGGVELGGQCVEPVGEGALARVAVDLAGGDKLLVAMPHPVGHARAPGRRAP
jgi:hypothetical protein